MTTVDGFIQGEKTGKWVCTKDPDAELDYIENWTEWLDSVGDNIASATVAATGSDPASNAVVYQQIINGKSVVAWVRGGVAGETVALRYRVTTTNVPPRTDDRTVYLKIKDR